MIPFDFEYYQPTTLDEVVKLHAELSTQGKEPMYYGGGTEIISFSRLYQLYPRAVIDIKGIPECNVLGQQGGKLIIGATISLSQIQESNLFPLLSQCGGRVADHTIRNKITLGGNICSRLPYREAILALLVSDSELTLQGPQGKRTVPLRQVYNQVLQLTPGEFIVQVVIDQKLTGLPFISFKKTTEGNVGYPQDKIGYPVVSAAAIKTDSGINVAFSGLCNFPFRSPEMEAILNNPDLTEEERLNQACNSLPANILNDIEGSAQYRQFVLKNILLDMLAKLEG